MGIPSYFVHIVKNHSNIIKKYQSDCIDIQNLSSDLYLFKLEDGNTLKFIKK